MHRMLLHNFISTKYVCMYVCIYVRAYIFHLKSAKYDESNNESKVNVNVALAQRTKSLKSDEQQQKQNGRKCTKEIK